MGGGLGESLGREQRDYFSLFLKQQEPRGRVISVTRKLPRTIHNTKTIPKTIPKTLPNAQTIPKATAIPRLSRAPEYLHRVSRGRLH